MAHELSWTTVNVDFKADVTAALDAEAAKQGVSRARLIRTVMTSYLEGEIALAGSLQPPQPRSRPWSRDT